jgi:fatty acid synthase
VCAQAGILPSQVAYIEAHGTGTVVGDAQELGALEDFYAIGGEHTPEDPLLIGSVKFQHGALRGLLWPGR